MQYSFDIEVAKRYGVDGAIILNNMQFWIEKNKANKKHFHDDYYWTYNSIKAFEELFPFWTRKQIRRILETLEKKEAIKTGNFNKAGYDRTKWYTIAQTVNSICPNGQMEMPKQSNGIDQKGKPIPYINTYINTDINNTSFQKQVFEYWVEQSIDNKCLTNHKKYTKDMETALKSVANTYKHDFAKCKEFIDRFCLIYRKSQNTQYPLKQRTLQEFFGQKAYQSKSLIFQEYDDEGCKWLNYKNNNSTGNSKTKTTTADTVNNEALRKAQEFMQRRKEGCC